MFSNFTSDTALNPEKRFMLGGQQLFVHEEGKQTGYLHVYKHFHISGSPHNARRIDIFLPGDYSTSQERYPVLYMNDGHTTFFKGGCANKSWYLDDVINNLYIAQEIHKLIVVAIYPVNRNAEYTHAMWYGKACCELSLYCQYITDIVKPFIDRVYRTYNDPKYSMIVGASHGGLAAFYIANKRPDIFGFCGALSPSFWVGIDHTDNYPYVKMSYSSKLKNSQLIKLLKDTLYDAKQRPTMYIDWGLVRTGGPHNEFIEHVATIRGREMATLLQEMFNYKLGKSLIICEDNCGEHSEASWGRRMYRVLKLFVGC